MGELCGIDPVGVIATDDVDALLALEARLRHVHPDVVERRRARADPRRGCQRGEHGGVHQRQQARRRPGPHREGVRTRRVDRCSAAAISPGFAELLAIVSAMICDRIDKVTVSEEADTHAVRLARYGVAGRVRATHRRSRTARRWPRAGTAVFGEAVALVADAIGVDLDEIVCESEFAQTTEDLDLGSWKIPAGCVAGVSASWQGRVDGRTVIELSVRWKKGTTLEPDWTHSRRACHRDRRPPDGAHQARRTCRRPTSRRRPSLTSWCSG